MFNNMISLYYYTCFINNITCLFAVVYGVLAVKPQNDAVYIGQEVTMQCQTNGSAKLWWDGSSGMTTTTRTDKRIGQALRNLLCGHMFLLCSCGPYVSI